MWEGEWREATPAARFRAPSLRDLGTPENPALIIYRIRPVRVRFMREWALEYHEVPFGK